MDVIYYNEGRHECFEHSLASVKKHNPEAKIHLLEAQNFADKYEWFENSYVHMSTNPPYFEKACLRRWPIISGYVNENQIKLIDTPCVLHHNHDRQYWLEGWEIQNLIQRGQKTYQNKWGDEKLSDLTVYRWLV